jgi:DNA-binding transcriptional MerR regulator
MAQVAVGRTLRRWGEWSTRNVDELAAVATAFVWSLGLDPQPETTASGQISRRTIRYYVASGLMTPPEGQTRTASYGYRHLLELLYIKARQHQGDRLEEIQSDIFGDERASLEERLLALLPESVPPPLPVEPDEFARPDQRNAALRRWAYLTGRAGRWPAPSAAGSVVREPEVPLRGAAASVLSPQPPALEAMEVELDTASAQSLIEEPALTRRVRQEHFASGLWSPPATSGQPRHRVHIPLDDESELVVPASHPLAIDDDGRDQIVRAMRRLIRDYLHGDGGRGRGR